MHNDVGDSRLLVCSYRTLIHQTNEIQSLKAKSKRTKKSVLNSYVGQGNKAREIDNLLKQTIILASY